MHSSPDTTGREALVGADQHHPASPDGHKGRMSGGSAHNTLFCHRVEQQHLVELIPSVVNLVAVLMRSSSSEKDEVLTDSVQMGDRLSSRSLELAFRAALTVL